jgi:phosphopantetheinyl transferase
MSEGVQNRKPEPEKPNPHPLKIKKQRQPRHHKQADKQRRTATQ